MSGVKISALPAANAATDTDQLEVNQGGVSRRLTVGQIVDQIEETFADPIYAHGADGACGANDLAALDAMLAEQVADLPKLHVWAKTSIDVGSLIPGSDLCDPMPYLQKIFAAFDTPGLQGRHFIFGRQRAWNFLTRPTRGPIAVTADRTLTSSETDQIFINTGATALVNLTLPTTETNVRQVFEFCVVDTDGINIIGTPSSIRIGSGTLGTSIKSLVIGARARLTRITTTLWSAEVDAVANWTVT